MVKSCQKEPPKTVAELIARVREKVGNENCCFKRILKGRYTRDREVWFMTGVLAVLHCFESPEATALLEEWNDDLRAGRRPGSNSAPERKARGAARRQRIAAIGNQPRFFAQ